MNYFKKNKATHKEIEEHFKGCLFEPALGSYVEVSPYIEKILNNAERFEYWANNELAGLVAIYCNDFKNRECFVTMASVMTKYTGQGIARKLLNQAISYAKQLNFVKIKLEVMSSNKRAIRIYEKFGFKKDGERDNFIKMSMSL